VNQIVLPPPTPEEAGEGKQALEEAAAMAVGADLSSRAELNKINALFREDRRETHLYRCAVFALWTVAIVFVLLFIALAAHKVLPQQYRFLSPDEINSLTEFLFTGFLGGAVTKGGEALMRRGEPS
jgi:hypothetical protein